ncbi:MAG: AAA family ATPase [Candidatus Midichloria sp.]|nr:AAA family ATPase [Candidatus Midichloria sp.]
MKSKYIGLADFRKLVTGNDAYYVDKITFYIQHVIENTEGAILIIRPRRGGKSLNFDMLKKFLTLKLINFVTRSSIIQTGYYLQVVKQF